jgi:endonuclease III
MFSRFLTQYRTQPKFSQKSVQEEVRSLVSDSDYPWAVWVVMALQNRTTQHVVRRCITQLLRRYPTPASMASTSMDELVALIKPCGFPEQKAAALLVGSREILEGFKPETVISGAPYTAEAISMFAYDVVPAEIPGDKVMARLWVAYQQFINSSA